MKKNRKILFTLNEASLASSMQIMALNLPALRCRVPIIILVEPRRPIDYELPKMPLLGLTEPVEPKPNRIQLTRKHHIKKQRVKR